MSQYIAPVSASGIICGMMESRSFWILTAPPANVAGAVAPMSVATMPPMAMRPTMPHTYMTRSMRSPLCIFCRKPRPPS